MLGSVIERVGDQIVQALRSVLVTSSNNPYKFRAYRSAALNSANSYTKITFDAETFDTNNNFDTSNGRYTAPVAGYYLFMAAAGNTLATGAMGTALYKNGSVYAVGNFMTPSAASSSGNKPTVTHLIPLAANDYVEVFFIGGSGSVMEVGTAACWFEGILITTV